VRMVLTDDVTDDSRRLVIRLVGVRAKLVHRVQHAPVDRLESVPNVGERAADDHAHGVIEVAATHLVFEVYRDDFLGEFGHRVSVLGKVDAAPGSDRKAAWRLHSGAIWGQVKKTWKDSHERGYNAPQ